MAMNINLSICLTDLPKDKMVRADSNGKVYINLDAYVKDEVDKYGKDVAVSIPLTKEEKEMNPKPARVYVGNGKTFVFENTQTRASESDIANLGWDAAAPSVPGATGAATDESDDLPF